MLRIRNLRVGAYAYEGLTVFWEIEPTTEDLASFEIVILRSGAWAGEYVPVSPPFPADTAYFFLDETADLLSLQRDFFYQVSVRDVNTDETQIYGSTPTSQVQQGAEPGGVRLEVPPDLEAAESIRRFGLILREFSGERVLHLTPRTWGQHCPECWDALKRRAVKSSCLTCWGTGFAGGYWPPLLMRVLKAGTQHVNQLTQLFKMEPRDQILQAGAVPPIKPADLLISVDGVRRRVISVSENLKNGALTKQHLQVRALTRDQVEYQIRVEESAWDGNSLSARPLRQYLKASDIDSYRTALDRQGISDHTVSPERSGLATTLEGSDADE